MTDPDETANIVVEITAAFREHAEEAATERPLTYHEAMDLSLPDQIARYEELTDRNLMARSIATLQARGEYDQDKHPDPGKYQPLTVAEHLEMLALGEAIAFYYRHPAGVDDAVRAGATWEQIAAATEHHGRSRPGRLPRVGRRSAQVRGHERRRVRRGARGRRADRRAPPGDAELNARHPPSTRSVSGSGRAGVGTGATRTAGAAPARPGGHRAHRGRRPAMTAHPDPFKVHVADQVLAALAGVVQADVHPAGPGGHGIRRAVRAAGLRRADPAARRR